MRNLQGFLTCHIVNTSAVHDSREQFHPDDGINYDDKEDEESDLKERHNGLQDGIHNYLQTYRRNPSKPALASS